MLRYTSLQSYKFLLQDIPLPSLSLLQKISSGTIDAVTCANALRIEGKISEDVYLIFDEMYLQNSREYFWREMIGCDDKGELYKVSLLHDSRLERIDSICVKIIA